MEAPMATDPREVETLADCLTSIGIPREQQRHAAAAKLRALAADNAALREKLEAAEAERAEQWRQRRDAEASRDTERAINAAAQAAAWEAGRDAAANDVAMHPLTRDTIRALTAPADLSAALQRVRDETWNDAIVAAVVIAGKWELIGPTVRGIRALRRSPTEGEG